MGYKELENIRSRLNHNKVKNEFLNKIGSIRKDFSIAERSKLITNYWDSLRDTSFKCEDLKAIKETVTKARENWPAIEEEIKDFFDNAPLRCGYKGTTRFEDARKNFFDGQNATIQVISKFVRDFEQIAVQSEEDRNLWLEKFWEAADSIHDTLAQMRTGMEENALFGEYFKEI